MADYGWNSWEEYFYFLLCGPVCERCGAVGDVAECLSKMEATEKSAEQFSICAAEHVTRLG